VTADCVYDETDVACLESGSRDECPRDVILPHKSATVVTHSTHTAAHLPVISQIFHRLIRRYGSQRP
jgi:hypothetical protein